MKDHLFTAALALAIYGANSCLANAVPTNDFLTLEDTLGPIREHVENIDLSGDTFIAGGDDFEAVVFRRNGNNWQEETRLRPWDGHGSIFGYSVAVYSDVAVVSNPWDNNFEGSIYIYRRISDVWQPSRKFELPTDSRNEWFGAQVAADGDWIASGAPLGRNALGSVYLFRRENDDWVQHSVLQSPDQNPEDRFGATVDIAGDRMIIGADANNLQGSAYVYHLVNGQWTFQDKLASPDPVPNEFFGQRVAIDGNTAVVGSTTNESAYVYEFDGTDWNYATAITPSTRDYGVAPVKLRT